MRSGQFRLLLLLLAVLACSGVWCFTERLWIPHQISEAAVTGRPRGNLSDLYGRWLGARELLLHGRDPYSAAITREIQAGYYGRPLDLSRPNDPKDRQGFAYPIYVVFLLAPTIRSSFGVVRVTFIWLLVGAIVASILLWLRALAWKISAISILIWISLVLGSFPAVQGIKLQQLTLLVSTLLAACAASLVSGHFVLAGILLALATIKPQLACILIAWLLLWAASDWRRRQVLVWSFTLAMLALIGGGEVVLPGWIGRFRVAASAYWEYTGGGKSLLDVALTPTLGRLTAVTAVLLLIAFSWRMRHEPANSPLFAWTLAIVLTTTLLLIPTFALYNQLLLLPALMMITRSGVALWQRRGLERFFLMLAVIALLWPWFSALVLDALLLIVPQTRLQQAWAIPLWTSLALPFTVVATLCLVGPKLVSRAQQDSAKPILR